MPKQLSSIRGDIFGGITAAIVALPLALAFGVASGLGAIAGIYSAIAVGFFAAAFGGTPAQISGPTGPMTVVMAAVVAQYADRLETALAIVFLGGAQWNTNFDVFGPPFDGKSVYTFHRYWEEVTPALIEPYVAFRERYGAPLWMGESGENTYEWIAAFRTLLEQNEIGWCFWTYKRLDTDRCVASIERPTGWDQIVAFAEHPRSTYQEVREQRPPQDVIERALGEYLDNIRFEACRVNPGYLEALGF